MTMLHLQHRRLILAAVIVGLSCVPIVIASDDSTLTKEQIRQFLLTAKVVASKQSEKGVTNPWRLTLSDGTVTHDASFQPINVEKPRQMLANGTVEVNFVDSYKYNIAAYAVAELLGMDDMMPVYVERKWQGNTGSLSWWLPVKMDEQERVKQKIEPPDQDAWNKQMYKFLVFQQLVYDKDPNLTNLLISPDWKIWRIDFTRAFRLSKDVETPKNLMHCDRQLFEKLKTLDGNALAEKTKHYLSKDEVKGVMVRRDKIVAIIQQNIATKGEKEVLY
jgi:hypothetical protein